MGFLESHWLSPLPQPQTLERYKSHLDRGDHGSMDYLHTHLEAKTHPEKHFSKFKSVFVLTHSYLPHPEDQDLWPALKKARYAQGRDYHFWLKQKLNVLAQYVSEEHPEHEFQTATDSLPILERDWASQAGLGWIGKNTCLIHQKHGSFFFIGEILSTLDPGDLKLPTAHPKRCGSCNKCVEACPTEALSSTGLNSNKCIAYWTIETRDIPPENIQKKMSSYFFGCDICQSVCPWNELNHKAEKSKFEKDLEESSITPELIQNLEEVLTSSNKQLTRITKKLPLSRARSNGLKKNALLLVKSHKIKSLYGLVSSLEFEYENLKELQNEIRKLQFKTSQ